MNPELARTIQEALNSGELQSPVLFRGVVMVAGQAVPPAAHQFTFAENGWSHQSSELGGVASKAVEALKAELIQKGFAAVAERIPTFHISRFWQPPENVSAPDFASPDPTRFNGPDQTVAARHGLTGEKLNQAIRNLSAANNQLYGMAINLTLDWVANLYRGREDQKGFELFGGRPTITAHPGIPKDFNWNPIEENFPSPRIDAEKYNGQNPIFGSAHRDHFVYDLFFNTLDDADVARYWRSWARALGANV